MKLVLRAAASLAAVSLIGCMGTPMTTTPPLRPVPADLQMGRLSERTAFESDDLSSGSTPAPADADAGGASGAAGEEKVGQGLSLGGVGGAAAGGAGAIAFGAAGQITENKLDDAYDDGLTRSEESDLQDRGKTMNGLAIGSAVVALVGLSLTAIVIGVDYTRCGTIMKRRRKECRK